MTPKELVMSGYNFFADNDMESLGKIYHNTAVMNVNGNHELSGEYRGFDEFLNKFLSQIPIKFPNFSVNVLDVTSEANRVHVHLHYNADNLQAESVHMFVVEDELQTQFHSFDDSQTFALALST